jgi:hypothetical protein
MEESYQPLFDAPYSEALNNWLNAHQQWERGEHPDQIRHPEYRTKYPHYADYGGNAPDVHYYRPDWKAEEMTWYQVYETVSEGTPVTPPFETREELVEYLVANGDFWDQMRREEGNSVMGCAPWSRRNAEKFVMGSGWAPSMVIDNGVVKTGVEAIGDLENADVEARGK